MTIENKLVNYPEFLKLRRERDAQRQTEEKKSGLDNKRYQMGLAMYKDTYENIMGKLDEPKVDKKSLKTLLIKFKLQDITIQKAYGVKIPWKYLEMIYRKLEKRGITKFSLK